MCGPMGLGGRDVLDLGKTGGNSEQVSYQGMDKMQLTQNRLRRRRREEEPSLLKLCVMATRGDWFLPKFIFCPVEY